MDVNGFSSQFLGLMIAMTAYFIEQLIIQQ